MVRIAGPPLPYDRTYHLLARFDKIRACVKRHKPDILEAHSPYLGALGVLACGRTAPVRTAFWHADHVGTYLEPAIANVLGGPAAERARRPLWRAVRALLAPFDATFVAGRVQADRLRAAGVKRVVHVPFGVDSRTFRPRGPASPPRRELFPDVPDDALLVVGVGRFAVEKRWDVVLEAFERVRARRPAVLVLFGDGPERERLRRLASPAVHMPGFEPDCARLAERLAAADVLFHGCPYETYGLGVAEAVGCGLPVVVPDRGGAADSVDPASGSTYRALDPEACAAALERLLARDPDALRASALDAADRVPTMEQHFGAVLGTYDELLSEAR